jgi:single-stranded DNA-binding protein
MELVGKIRTILDPKDISATFRKRELVLTTEGRYPQQILVEFTQDKIAQLDAFAPGDEVKIQIDIRGREWRSPRGEVKYFVTIAGWRIENLAHANAGGPDDYGDYGDYASGPAASNNNAPPPFDDAPFPASPSSGSSPYNDDDIPF